MKRSIWLLVALLTPSAAQAASIHYRFTGHVTSLSDSLLSDFSLGESVVATVTIDDMDLYPQFAEFGSYAASDLTVTIGGDYTLTGSVGGAAVLDNAVAADRFQVGFFPGDVIGPRVTPGRPDTFSIDVFFRSSGLASDALPLSFPLPYLVQTELSKILFEGDANSLGFEIDSVTIVPEATTGLLLLTGLLGLAGWRRGST